MLNNLLTRNRLSKIYTPYEFLLAIQKNRNSVIRSRFIAPKLGSSDFGKFYVEFDYGTKQ